MKEKIPEIKIDASKGTSLLKTACDRYHYLPSCHDLATMYRQGYDSIAPYVVFSIYTCFFYL